MKGGITIGAVVVFYLIMGAAGWGLGQWLIEDPNLWVWHDDFDTSLLFDLAVGAGVGLVVVVLSNLVEHITDWGRELSEEFRKILGELSLLEVLVMATASSIAEEIAFRGFLQRAITEWFGGGTAGLIGGLVISSAVFAALHIGPDRKKFLPWTIMALVMGFVFGVMFYGTGNLLAPILAHFTINFFNLHLLTRGESESTHE